jgi:NAD(P)-dependent dehydrogenase (short-subunit alcohol dehydrogenase family)
MGGLEGTVARVIGRGSGIGRAVVERLLAEGARVGAEPDADSRPPPPQCPSHPAETPELKSGLYSTV